MRLFANNVKRKSMTVENVEQTTGNRIFRPIQANVDVFGDEDLFTYGSNAIENVRQFIEEQSRGRFRAWPVDRQNDAIVKTGRRTDSHGFKHGNRCWRDERAGPSR
jgi:hypothetical protein